MVPSAAKVSSPSAHSVLIGSPKLCTARSTQLSCAAAGAAVRQATTIPITHNASIIRLVMSLSSSIRRFDRSPRKSASRCSADLLQLAEERLFSNR